MERKKEKKLLIIICYERTNESNEVMNKNTIGGVGVAGNKKALGNRKELPFLSQLLEANKQLPPR